MCREDGLIICVAGKNTISVNVLEYLNVNNHGRYSLCVCCNRNESGKNKRQKSLRFYAKKNDIQEVELEELYKKENLIFLSTEYDRIIQPYKFKANRLKENCGRSKKSSKSI